jgi:hypothetical protein
LCVALALAAAAPLRAQIPAGSTTPARDSLPAVLIGRVVDSLGNGVVGADISVFRLDSIRTISVDSGAFRLGGIPAGTIVFNVRRIGYEPASFTAVLHGGRTHRATFTLSASVQTLPTVAVKDTAVQSHWLDQFEARRTREHGYFLTREDIVKRHARNGTDLVRTIPGVLVQPQGSGPNSTVLTNRNAGAQRCAPQLYVHGVAYSGTLDDFTADDIEALEVYVGLSEIPPELSRSVRQERVGRSSMGGPCAVIVIWTRDPKKRP